MIRAIRKGWPYMETWERLVLFMLLPLWVVVWHVLWAYMWVLGIFHKVGSN